MLGQFGLCHKLALNKGSTLSWRVLCMSLVLLFASNGGANESTTEDLKKQHLRDSIKRKQPDDAFLPAMIVFNLDHTLWPFIMELMQPPFVNTSIEREIKDKAGRKFSLFPEVHDLLEELDSKWYKLGGLCDNSDIDRVEQVITLFDVDQFFNALESKPGNKTEQMQRLSERAKVPLEDILYFDSNRIDLDDMKAMNVTGIWTHHQVGFTFTHLEQGFRVFSEAKHNATLAFTTTAAPEDSSSEFIF